MTPHEPTHQVIRCGSVVLTGTYTECCAMIRDGDGLLKKIKD